jgi:hypothetical protein
MKTLGGDWSRGDLLALIGVLVAILGIWISHRDTTTSEQQQPARIHESTAGARGEVTPQPATTVIPRSADVSSGQVNFGCEETQPVRTPEVFFGANPRDIQPRPEWVQTDNVKGHNQEVIYDKDPANHVKGVFAQGSITGLDKQLLNCPGGGHGALALHVTWTEEQTSTGSNQ